MIRIVEAGDTMLLVELGVAIDPVVNERVIALASALERRALPGIRDVVPAYCSLGVHFDPLCTDLVGLERAVRDDARNLGAIESLTDRPVREVPVAYGGDEGPDLAAVAEWSGCTADEVVERHRARVYRVYMLGFVPGFAYMGRVDSRIAAPRHRVPRERVAAGSVGIAGEQTGIYPIASPGGWQIIGRSEVLLFEATRTPASLFSPGDLVQFVPIRRGSLR